MFEGIFESGLSFFLGSVVTTIAFAAVWVMFLRHESGQLAKRFANRSIIRKVNHWMGQASTEGRESALRTLRSRVGIYYDKDGEGHFDLPKGVRVEDLDVRLVGHSLVTLIKGYRQEFSNACPLITNIVTGMRKACTGDLDCDREQYVLAVIASMIKVDEVIGKEVLARFKGEKSPNTF